MYSVIEREHLENLARLILPKLEKLDASVAKKFNLGLFFISIMEIFPSTLQSLAKIQKNSTAQITTLVLGCSGAGKSTLIAELSGYNLTLNHTSKNTYVLDYVDGQKKPLFERPLIGHGCTQTLGAVAYEASANSESGQTSFTFIDTGSISGTTSGIRSEICNTLALSMVFYLNPAKILIVLSSPYFRSCFGISFLELLQRLQWYSYYFCKTVDAIEIVFAINDRIENPLAKINEKDIRDSIGDTIHTELERLQRKCGDYLSENGPYNLKWFNEITKKLTELPLKPDHAPSEVIDEGHVDCLFSLLREMRFLTLIVTNIDKHFIKTNFNEKGYTKKELLNKLLNINPILIEKKPYTNHDEMIHLNTFKQVLLATSNFFNEIYSQETPGDEKTILLQSLQFFEIMSKLAEFFIENMNIEPNEENIFSNFIAQLSQAKKGSAPTHSTTQLALSSKLSGMGVFSNNVEKEKYAQTSSDEHKNIESSASLK